ncbi:protein of unknown function [Burkholderia multivorans]
MSNRRRPQSARRRTREHVSHATRAPRAARRASHVENLRHLQFNPHHSRPQPFQHGLALRPVRLAVLERMPEMAMRPAMLDLHPAAEAAPFDRQRLDLDGPLAFPHVARQCHLALPPCRAPHAPLARPAASPDEPEIAAVQQHRAPTDFLEHPARRAFDFRAMRSERVDQVPLHERRRAEVILERLGRDRALHATVVDQRREREHQIACAILGRIGGKGNVHDARLSPLPDRRARRIHVVRIEVRAGARLTHINGLVPAVRLTWVNAPAGTRLNSELPPAGARQRIARRARLPRARPAFDTRGIA